jgi:hypothetical protein
VTLQLETKDQVNKTAVAGIPGAAAAAVMLTPLIDEDYWAYRVQLSDEQAIVGFPKFGTVGIGLIEAALMAEQATVHTSMEATQ